MNISKLHDAIKMVCPIHGVDENGKISFKDEATEAEKAAAQSIVDNWIDVPDPIKITKLEFKNRLVTLNKYTESKAMLSTLSEDKKEDWELASCVLSDNADIIALMTALNINSNEIFIKK